VETGESVNHLEALAQWTHLSKLRAAFHLYVPATMVDVARRLCDDNHVVANEVWSYHTIGDQVRFTLVHRSKETVPVRAEARPDATKIPTPKKPIAAAPQSVKKVARPAPRAAKPAAKKTKPVAKARKPAKAQKRK